MELTPPEKVFAFGASPSMIDLWQLCPRKWWLHYIARQGRQAREAQKDSGTAFHRFFQDYYDPSKQMTLEEHIAQFKQDFPEEESTEKRDQAHLLEVLKQYTIRYPKASEPFKVLALEQKIQVPLEGSPLGLNIVIDMPVEWMGGLWAMDHKTTSVLGATFFDKFRNHWQTYTYTYGLGVAMQRPCEGVLYNAIGLKKKIDNESFLRKEITKAKPQIEYHMRKLVSTVTQMYEFVTKNWKDGEKFEMRLGMSCRAYNTNCPFLDYCEFNSNENLLPG